MVVQNMQQYTAEQVKERTINMEMQPMKQVIGMQMPLTLWIRLSLFSIVEVAVAMAMAQEYSAPLEVMAVPIATAARSVLR